MTHAQRLGRAGMLAIVVLAAGLPFTIPTFAQPLADDNSTATEVDPGEGGTPEAPLSPEPPTAAPSGTVESTGGPDPTATAEDQALPATDPATDTGTAVTPTDIATDGNPPDPEASPTATEPSPASPTPSPEPATPTASDPSASPSPTATDTASPVPSPTPIESPTPTPTSTPSPEIAGFVLAAAASFGPEAVLINEVAWAGTEASTSDEWIELWNPGSDPIDLEGWALQIGDDNAISLSGEIAAYGFYLLERSDDQTVADVAADRIYTGALNNGGERLELHDPVGSLIDTANAPGGAWPAGSTSPRRSMERHSLLDLPGSWSTFPGVGGNGIDAAGNPIGGTPRQPNASAAPSATPTAPPAEATPFPAGAVLINEIAWAGTFASSSDEWIELYNPGLDPIDLANWTLTDDGDIDVELTGRIDPGGYHLLERSDDQTVSDLPADVIYTGSLANDGEQLRLLDPTVAEIDVANPGGGPWPAGDADQRASMERGAGWATFAGYYGIGHDASGAPIRGTPRGPNSISFPAPTPTWIPGRVVINEVLIRPRYDWEGAGGVTTDDEFIELYNRGPHPVNLRGWTLDDTVVGGSKPYQLPPTTLQPGEFAVFFRSRTHIALNDTGDSVRLSAPDGSPVDKIRYLRVRAANLSYGRLPDGDDSLSYGLWPTPGESNHLFVPPGPFSRGAVVINEVAWAGTLASSNHEWIELYNPGPESVNLFGWLLTDDGDINIHLVGEIQSGGYYLLERTRDQTVADIPADRLYSGSLANDGERLRLFDPTGAEIDLVNPTGGAWPAGDPALRASMERHGERWLTFDAPGGPAVDADGSPVPGSPRAPNSAIPPASAACRPTTVGPPSCP